MGSDGGGREKVINRGSLKNENKLILVAKIICQNIFVIMNPYINNY